MFYCRSCWAFAQVFSIPVRVVKYGPNANEGDLQTLESAIRTIASDAGAAIPQPMEIELIESAKATGRHAISKHGAMVR
ncbi:DUF935 family protein [Agarivorans sp. B2Z047]|nr:DUF935 family protein [Agarivorans sp. B2Z047]